MEVNQKSKQHLKQLAIEESTKLSHLLTGAFKRMDAEELMELLVQNNVAQTYVFTTLFNSRAQTSHRIHMLLGNRPDEYSKFVQLLRGELFPKMTTEEYSAHAALCDIPCLTADSRIALGDQELVFLSETFIGENPFTSLRNSLLWNHHITVKELVDNLHILLIERAGPILTKAAAAAVKQEKIVLKINLLVHESGNDNVEVGSGSFSINGEPFYFEISGAEFVLSRAMEDKIAEEVIFDLVDTIEEHYGITMFDRTLVSDIQVRAIVVA